HIKDPLEPGIVIGKSAAMNWGGRWMVRILMEEGYDLSHILLTDLDSDWHVPMAVRVMSAATSQWQMFLHSRPHRLVAFSSYTCSLDFVQRAGYWDKD